MKGNRKFLMVMLTVVLVILSACGNASNESSASSGNQSQNNNSSQNTNDDSSKGDSTKNDSNTDNTDADTSDTDNESAKEDPSMNTTASLKEEYLQKVHDAKNEADEMRKNPINDTTFALKKVEGDTYDVLDGLLNEIYEVLKKQLSTEEMDQLRKEQREWIDYRDHTAKEASLKYEGGTMEQYEYVRVENNLTEERCFELVEDYMK